jgi:aminoglycoside phosphotransferase (APT) family kinase protein
MIETRVAKSLCDLLNSLSFMPASQPILAEKQGLISRVFLVETSNHGRIAIKINPSPGFLSNYEIESTCTRLARLRDIPCPEVFCVGTGEVGSYLIMAHVPGRNGGFSSDQEILETYEQLGRWSHQIHKIRCKQFGSNVSEEKVGEEGGDRNKKGWNSWLSLEWSTLVASQGYLEKELLTEKEILRFHQVFHLMENSCLGSPVLTHLDLSHENVMIVDGKPTWLLDWGNAIGSPGLSFDLAPLYMWQNPDRIMHFQRGYGAEIDELRSPSLLTRFARIWYTLKMMRWMSSEEFVSAHGDPSSRFRRLIRVCSPWIDECFGG